MKEDDFLKGFSVLFKAVVGIFVLLILVLGLGWLAYQNPDILRPSPQIAETPTEAEPAMVAEGDFIEGEHKLLVVANCTGCHSGKLVTQNRATREGWTNMIRWMQRTQNLKDLGADEQKILDYLSENYAPAEQGRRANLVVDEWYKLGDLR
ncbi:MAG: monoheme cytochrome C [Roseivirga sp.]|nr:monoheme cytochrome C [Roseivirga sp.]